MKLLIIAGPYEADRLRKAAVSAGFETVAVEPGESLSGWIAASRPDLIVMAPKIVNADPTVALGKVRAVPRGRVPIFLVGDASDEPRFKGLADGFFMRPVSPDDLIAEARALLGTPLPANVPAGEGSGPFAAPTPGSGEGIPERHADTGSDGAREPGSGHTPKSGPQALKTPPNLKPLVAQSDSTPPPRAHRPAPGTREHGRGRKRGRDGGWPDVLDQLDKSIEATLDADIREAIRGLHARGRAGTPVGRPRHASREVAATPPPAVAPASPAADDAGAEAAGENQALSELRDESSQKTLEVPRDVVARMASADSEGIAAGPDARARAAGVPAPTESGDLAQQDLPALLGRIYTQRLTGWLTVRRAEVEKAIVFDRGAPILAGSNVPDDRMGDMLVRQGLLTAEQQLASVDILRATGRRLGVVLVDSGFIKAGELGPLVRRHFEEIIYSAFAWEDGEWAMSPDRPEKEETVLMKAHPAALIIEGIRRKYRPARLRARLATAAGAVWRLSRRGGLSALLDEMDLAEDERRIVGLVDGVRPIEEIAAHAGVNEGTALGVAWALRCLRRLVPAEMAEETTTAAAAAGAEGGGAPAGNGERSSERDRERDREIDRARILARYALVREGDYFQILGVPRDAGPHEIKRAHEALVRALDARALAPDLAADLAGPLEAIAAVAAEGARVLADARLRPLYQRHLAGAPAGPERSA